MIPMSTGYFQLSRDMLIQAYEGPPKPEKKKEKKSWQQCLSKGVRCAKYLILQGGRVFTTHNPAWFID